MRMEAFLLKALNCPPNEKILLRMLEDKFNLCGFKVLSLELPILLEVDYGFIDLFGLNEGSNNISYIFVETKSEFPGAKKQAENDLKEYYYGYSKNGLFSDDMSRLYHQTVFEKNRHVYDPTRKTLFLPLVISSSLVENTSKREFENVLSDFAVFMGERVCQKVPALERSVHALIDEKLVPRYPNIVIDNKGERLIVYCYDYHGDTVTREISSRIHDLLGQVPSKEGMELNNNQLLSLLAEAKYEKAFAIHYNLGGFHRPNLFLETERGKYACLQHIGLGGFKYMGIYNEEAVLDYDDSMIYSTVLVDRGNYWVVQAGRQALVVQLAGNRFQGRLKLSFGASISFTTKFTFETGQTTLARF